MIRHTQQIGGVTVTFAMGHVNELRGESPTQGGDQSGPLIAPRLIDWLCTVPGIPAGWGSSFHGVEPKS